MQKAEIIRAAALASAQPSGQDMRVASKAAAMAGKTRAELTEQGRKEATEWLAGAKESTQVEPTSDMISPETKTVGSKIAT